MRSAALVLLLVLSGCGIDRGGAPEPDGIVGPSSPPPSPTPFVVSGPIESITTTGISIGGTSINVQAASIRIDGAAANAAQLAAGEYAVVRGTSSSSQSFAAQTITVDAQVIGLVTAFDAGSNTLSVVGQQVKIDDNTLVDQSLLPLDFADVAGIGRLRIGAVRRGHGELMATYVGPTAAATDQLTGFVAMPDVAATRFNVGGQPVSYAAAQLIDLPGGMPVANQRLLTTGALTAFEFAAQTLVAAPLIPDDVEAGSIIRVTAALTTDPAGRFFELAFTPAELAPDATIENGALADLIEGTIVYVEGAWTTDARIDVSALRFVTTP